MTRLQSRRSPFPADLYAPWCRVWLRVQEQRDRLADWLGRTGTALVDKAIAVAKPRLPETILGLDARLGTEPAPETDLARALGCLLELEQLHLSDPRARLSPPTSIPVAGRTHCLIPPPTLSTRPAGTNAGFPLGQQLGIRGALGLVYRWQALPSPDSLQWRLIPYLARNRLQDCLRVGLAPFACSADMAWACDPEDARGLDGRVPVRCLGGKDPSLLREIVEPVLQAAWDARVHLLLLPELVVDEVLLAACRDWLRTRNAREQRLRLVLAGSRHCLQGEAFANRCTLLGPLGDTLWEQGKRTPFVNQDPGALARLSPDAPVAKVFEPTALGAAVMLGQSDLGRLLSPICLDYIEGDLWGELGADLYLVPAMTGGLSRFRERARELGGSHGAASFICNAQTAGEDRCHSYLPVKRGGPSPRQVGDLPLFTIDVVLGV